MDLIAERRVASEDILTLHPVELTSWYTIAVRFFDGNIYAMSMERKVLGKLLEW